MAIKVIVDNRIPFIKGALERAGAEVKYIKGSTMTKEKIMDADALIIRTRTICNEKLLAGTNVKFIASATIGYDHIDTEYCEANGIKWANAPGCNSGSVTQYLAVILSMVVARFGAMPKELTLGIVGVGNVGTKVQKLAKSVGMKTVLCDPPERDKLVAKKALKKAESYVTLDELIAKSHIITLHVPLTREGDYPTYHMINENNLKDVNAIVVNTSRGGVVDGEALLKELDRPGIAACLDVWENEPVINRELMNKCLLATPHIAGYSADGKANGSNMAVEAVNKFFELGMEPWEPEIPVPEGNEIEMEYAMDRGELLLNLLANTYSLFADDDNLRNHPDKFEYLRNNYGLRREPNAFKFPGEIEKDKKLKHLPWTLSFNPPDDEPCGYLNY